jgi:uncharacterized protein YgiM (DUF1202 family)
MAGGAQFDKYGRWINPNYQPQTVSGFSATSRTRTRRHGFWGRTNDFVANVGEWLGNNNEAFAVNLSFVYYVLVWVGLAIGVIAQWIEDGFFSALITAVIGGVIVFYTAMIVAVIFMYFMRVVLWVARWIFYNIYTLLIFVVIVLGLCFSNQIIDAVHNLGANRDPVSISVPVLQTNYMCTADVLNVRYTGSANSRIIGKLTQGTKVHVYGIDRATGFAKIDYNGSVAYASARYLKPTETTSSASQISPTSTIRVVENSAKSGWSTFLLQKQVESVIYNDGRYIYFNTDGNVVKHNVRKAVRGREEFEYIYSNPTHFVLKGDESVPFEIILKDDTRKEIWKDGDNDMGYFFTYDNKHRLVEVRQPEYGFGVTETYTYKGRNTYPSQTVLEYYDEIGLQTNTFTYSDYEFDKNGNWTERSVRQQMMEAEYEPEEKTTQGETKTYSESRTITYF